MHRPSWQLIKVVIVTTIYAGMDKTVSAVEANRRFSHILRSVRAGERYVVTVHGKPVARIAPVGPEMNSVAEARQALFARLAAEPVVDIGHWTRDELYER